jgi:hypothetical protein
VLYLGDGFQPALEDAIDATTNDRVGTDGDEGGNDAVAITPSTNQESAKWFVWVPSPAAGTRYYVTVTIYQPRKGDVDVPLADFDTAEFEGAPAR